MVAISKPPTLTQAVLGSRPSKSRCHPGACVEWGWAELPTEWNRDEVVFYRKFTLLINYMYNKIDQ